jgi:multidrug efflux pump subunit AcrA (membrane-fusion protein)
MRFKLLIAVVLLAVGVGAVGVAIIGLPGGSTPQTQYLTSQATRTTVSQEAVATGTVAATATYGLAFGQPAALVLGTSTSGGGTGTFVVETVKVGVGDVVSAGETLATADTSELQVALVVAEANFAAANARLVTDTGGPAADVIASAQDALTQARQSVANSAQSRADSAAQRALALKQAEQAVVDARAKLAGDQAGTTGTSDQIASAKDQIATAERNLASAQQNVLDVQAQNAQSLASAEIAVQRANLQQQLDVNNPASSAATLAADQRAVVDALANLDGVQIKNEQSMRQAQSQVSDAEIAIASAQRNLTSLQTPSSAAIDADRSALDNAEANLKALQLNQVASAHQTDQQLAQAQDSLVAAQHSYESKTTTATTDATIASDRATLANAELAVSNAKTAIKEATITSPVDGTVVDATLVPGVVAPSGFAFKVQTRDMEVTASFPEADLTSLKVGQPANVTLTATNKVVAGIVKQITPVAATSGTSSVVSYAVIVSLTGTSSQAGASGSGTTAPSPAIPSPPGPAETSGPSASGAPVPGGGASASTAPATAASSPHALASGAPGGVPGGGPSASGVPGGNAPGASAPTPSAPAPSASTDPPESSAPIASDQLDGVYAGMTAKVSIITASAADVVAVPVAALVGTAGAYRVRVLDANGAIQAVTVEVGLVTSSLAEITSGVDEGATVVTGTSADRTGSSSSTSTNRGGTVIPGLDGGGFPGGGFPGGVRGTGQ